MALNDEQRAFNTALFGDSGYTVTRAYIATLMRLTASLLPAAALSVEVVRCGLAAVRC